MKPHCSASFLPAETSSYRHNKLSSLGSGVAYARMMHMDMHLYSALYMFIHFCDCICARPFVSVCAGGQFDFSMHGVDASVQG